ncbi:MAG: helix-turn-helix domain-containing protein [Candidatus Krumholzibacteria bacterium]|nr:helix-turn-helix domain-containing protein [Candidatus Krumholzibacteria bacterium]
MTEDKERPGDQLELSGDEPEQAEFGGEETVGEMLLTAREKKGLTLEVVSQESKIPVTTLQLLETDNFEAIPAKVYATGFLRAYGQILGLDSAQLVNKYEVQTGQTHKSRGDLWEIEEEVVEEKLASPHLLRKFVIPLILVIAMIIILWKIFGGKDEGAERPATFPEAGQLADAESGAQTDDLEGREDDTGDAASGSRQDQGSRDDTDREAEEPLREQPPADPPQQESAADPPAAGEMSLRIAARERIWFDLIVYNQTDSGLVTVETDFILEAGESRIFTSNESFYIRKIGKTEGFIIELDGRPYEVPIIEGRLPRDITISRDR